MSLRNARTSSMICGCGGLAHDELELVAVAAALDFTLTKASTEKA